MILYARKELGSSMQSRDKVRGRKALLELTNGSNSARSFGTTVVNALSVIAA